MITKSTTRKKQCAVLGIGNTILGDEGLGVHLVNRLRNKYHFFPEIALIDGGCGGMSLYFIFEQYDPVIIVDALSSVAGEPGVTYLMNGNLLTGGQTKGCSCHHVGLSDVLLLLRALSSVPDDIVLIGVVPVVLEFSTSLSTTIEKQMTRVEDMVLQQLYLRKIEGIRL